MYEDVLKQAGLTVDQAAIYEALLQNGPSSVGDLAPKTSYKRGMVYKVLSELEDLGIVDKDKEEGKITIFRPVHPLRLKGFAEKQERKAKEAQVALERIMPRLTSEFNLALGKPNIRFFEGKEGVIQVFEEIIKEKEQIDSIEGKGEMEKFLPEYHEQFVRRRVKRGVKNRVICPSAHPGNKTSKKELRETRRIAAKKYPLSMDITIVKDKVTLSTFSEDSAIGIVIDHPEIAKNFRILFQYIWDTLEKPKR